jgi:hypothetical protein
MTHRERALKNELYALIPRACHRKPDELASSISGVLPPATWPLQPTQPVRREAAASSPRALGAGYGRLTVQVPGASSSGNLTVQRFDTLRNQLSRRPKGTFAQSSIAWRSECHCQRVGKYLGITVGDGTSWKPV